MANPPVVQLLFAFKEGTNDPVGQLLPPVPGGLRRGFCHARPGGRVLADCRTASLIRRTVQSTLTQLKYRTNSRLIVSNGLSAILCQTPEPLHGCWTPPKTIPFKTRETLHAVTPIRIYCF
jgi:hypothetical protein